MKNIKEQFLKDVANHEMCVLHEHGIYRHVRFGSLKTIVHQFEMVTWPGYLAYAGDMGSFVFRRLDDMFEFFGGGPELSINPSYWSEKLVAVDGHRHEGKAMEFSPTLFKEALLEDVKMWADGNDAEFKRIWKEVENEIIPCADDGEYAAMLAVRDFKDVPSGFEFVDFHEHTLRDFTGHFLWCCYALVWGINKYRSETKKIKMKDNYVCKIIQKKEPQTS